MAKYCFNLVKREPTNPKDKNAVYIALYEDDSVLIALKFSDLALSISEI